MINEYQKLNIEILEEERADGKTQKQHAIKGNWTYGLSGVCKCVSCGKRNLTYPIMKFFNWDGNKFLCWKCQLKNK